MNMFDYQEGRKYAIQMIEAASSAPKNKDDMAVVIQNLEESAKNARLLMRLGLSLF